MNRAASKKVFLILLILTGCSSPKATKLISFVQTGAPESRDIGAVEEEVNNCGAGGGTIEKQSSRGLTTNYAVEWEYGGTTGFGVVLGEGVIPGGINLDVTMQGLYKTAFGSGLEAQTSWTLPAEPNTIVIYTILWRETWQTGYVSALLPGELETTINVRYRVGIDSQIINKAVVSCGEASVISTNDDQQSEVAPQDQSIEGQLDLLLGHGNWRCIDGFSNSISISNIPTNFQVQPPFVRVDKLDVFYQVGDTIFGGGYATGWLTGSLLNSNCSSTKPVVDANSINGLLGLGNWYCLEIYPTGVKARSIPDHFAVESPAILVDKNNTRYYPGQEVPEGGNATVWFASNISPSDCP